MNRALLLFLVGRLLQFGRLGGIPLSCAFRISILNDQIAALDVAQCPQAVAKCIKEARRRHLRRAEIADAMATPVTIMGIRPALCLINQMKGIGCIIIDDNDRLYTSDNIKLTA